MKILRSMALSIWVWLKVDARPWLNRHTGLILLCVLLCMLGSCVYSCTAPPRSYQFLHDVSSVEKNEICKKTENNRWNKDPVEVLLTIDKEDHAKIFADIQALPSWRHVGDPLLGIGEYQFRIYYNTGEMEIIGITNNVYVSADGRWRSSISKFDDSFVDLILELLSEAGIATAFTCIPNDLAAVC